MAVCGGVVFGVLKQVAQGQTEEWTMVTDVSERQGLGAG
jgi:hypothetical protein